MPPSISSPIQFPLLLAPVSGTPEPWGSSLLTPDSGELHHLMQRSGFLPLLLLSSQASQKQGKREQGEKPGGESFPQLGLSCSSQSLRSPFGGLPLFSSYLISAAPGDFCPPPEQTEPSFSGRKMVNATPMPWKCLGNAGGESRPAVPGGQRCPGGTMRCWCWVSVPHPAIRCPSSSCMRWLLSVSQS